MPIMQAVISNISNTMPNGTELSRFNPRSIRLLAPNVFCLPVDFSLAGSAELMTDGSSIADAAEAVDDSLCDDCADAILQPSKFRLNYDWEIVGMRPKRGQCNSWILQAQPALLARD
jgi:hypothetical protein